MRTVRSFGTEARELAEFARSSTGRPSMASRTCAPRRYKACTAVLIGGLATAVLVSLAAVLVHRAAISTGAGCRVHHLLGLLYQPLVRLTQFYGGITATLAAVDRITEVLDEPEPAAARATLAAADSRRSAAAQRLVRLSAAAGRSFSNGSISGIEPGMTVGIWGPSGSGKSTLLALVPRLYDLRRGGGRILLDGRDIARCRPADLPRAVCLVPQQARLFEGTIRSNLTYAARDADEALIRRALEAVDLAELVGSLPQGLETPVGERRGEPFGRPAAAVGPGPRPDRPTGRAAARRLHQRPRCSDRSLCPRANRRVLPAADAADRLAQAGSLLPPIGWLCSIRVGLSGKASRERCLPTNGWLP